MYYPDHFLISQIWALGNSVWWHLGFEIVKLSIGKQSGQLGLCNFCCSLLTAGILSPRILWDTGCKLAELWLCCINFPACIVLWPRKIWAIMIPIECWLCKSSHSCDMWLWRIGIRWHHIISLLDQSCSSERKHGITLVCIIGCTSLQKVWGCFQLYRYDYCESNFTSLMCLHEYIQKVQTYLLELWKYCNVHHCHAPIISIHICNWRYTALTFLPSHAQLHV